MNKFIRLIAMLLTLACLASCGNGNTSDPVDSTGMKEEVTTSVPEIPEEPQDPLQLIKNGKTEYRLVYSTEADSITKNAMAELRQAFQEYTGVSIGTSDDYLKEGETHEKDTHRILVGVTNYPESQEAYQAMKYKDYLVTAKGTHLLVIAFTEAGYMKAIDWLRLNVFAKVSGEGSQKTLIMDEKPFKGSTSNGVYIVPQWTIAGNDLEKYRIVYSDALFTNEVFALRRELGEITGYYLDVVKDTATTAQEHEILFGTTNRAESAQVEEPTYLNYTIKVVGSKLVVKTGGEHSMRNLLRDFVNSYCESAFRVDMEATYSYKSNYYDDPYNTSKPAGTDARVMTCNILAEWENYGGGEAPISYRKEIFFSMIDYYQPTVIGLQEMSPTWYKILPEYADWDKWDILDDYKSPNINELVYSTVMYRKDLYDLVGSGMIYYSKFNNGRCRCITWAKLKDKASGQEFVFVSTHWDGASGENAQIQLDECVEFVNMMRANCPVITTGDFNSNEWAWNFKEYLKLIESSDAKYAAAKRLNDIGSWHELNQANHSAGACDHITTTNKDIEVLKFEMMVFNEQIYCSDHAWAFADIKFK